MASTPGTVTFNLVDETAGHIRRRPAPSDENIEIASNSSLEAGYSLPLASRLSYSAPPPAGRTIAATNNSADIQNQHSSTAASHLTRSQASTLPAVSMHRREMEARRYSGKEPVKDYLLQFELTARRNGWTDIDKAWALLCALGGPARGILAEFEDPATASYRDIKQSLEKRFGPTQQVEVHEHALSQLHMTSHP